MKKAMLILTLSSGFLINAEQTAATIKNNVKKEVPFFSVIEKEFNKTKDHSRFEKESHEICMAYYKDKKLTKEQYVQQQVDLIVKYYNFLKDFMSFTGKPSSAAMVKTSLEAALPNMELQIQNQLKVIEFEAKENNCKDYKNHLETEKEIKTLVIQKYKEYIKDVVEILENI